MLPDLTLLCLRNNGRRNIDVIGRDRLCDEELERALSVVLPRQATCRLLLHAFLYKSVQ